jgi:hypothetical protein
MHRSAGEGDWMPAEMHSRQGLGLGKKTAKVRVGWWLEDDEALR